MDTSKLLKGENSQDLLMAELGREGAEAVKDGSGRQPVELGRWN